MSAAGDDAAEAISLVLTEFAGSLELQPLIAVTLSITGRSHRGRQDASAHGSPVGRDGPVQGRAMRFSAST